MDKWNLDMGTSQTAAQLRFQLAQMTAVTQVLARRTQDRQSLEYLAAADQSICRMLRIVGRLELSARLGEASPPRVELEPVDLAERTGELGARMAGLLSGAGVQLTVRTPARLSAWADWDLLQQMLLELVANAAKAGRTVLLTLARQDKRAVFTVEDDGPGIPPDRLEYLFHSADSALPDWRQGGVGVAIARRAADLHGGTLVADCAPGQGLRAAASIPLGAGEGNLLLRRPAPRWDSGGFDAALIAFSGLLPAQSFGPEDE